MKLNALIAGAALASGFVAGNVGNAATVFDATTGATATTGYITSDNPTLGGTEYNHPDVSLNRFRKEHLIDGDLSTYTNTYSGTEISSNGNNTAPLDFVGVMWGSAVSDITAIRLHQFIFFDGGWFGTQAGDQNTANTGSPPTNTVAANNADALDVAAPTVQVTRDDGTSWSSIVSTNDYISIVKPNVQVNFIGRIETPILFEFDEQDNIDGIRLVGYGGGRSDVFGGRDEQGWISASELEVGRTMAPVPIPAGLPLLLIGIAGFAGLRIRKDRKASI